MPPLDAPVDQDRGPTPFPPAIRRVDWVTLVVLFAAAIAIRFVALDHKPFWFDECFSVEIARIDWRNFARLLWWREANMSLYYLLLRVWIHFGQSEFFIRSLSVVISAATVPAIYWVASQLYNRRVALIAAALFTFNAYSLRYAQEARSYSLFVLLATLSSGFLIAFLRNATRRNRMGFVVSSVLAVYAHFYALLLLAAQWLALRWIGRAGNHPEHAAVVPAWHLRTRQMGSSWKMVGVAVVPLLIFVAKTGAGPLRWIHRPGLRDVVELFQHLAGSDVWLLPLVYIGAVIAAVIPLGKRLWARCQDWDAWRAQFLLVWLLFPVILTSALSVARPVFLDRYLIFCLPPFVILAAAGLARVERPWLLAPVLAGVLLLASQGILFVYGHDFDTERDASGAATAFILDHAEPGDAIVFHIAATRVPYEFFRSARSGENTASPAYLTSANHGAHGPEILFPRHGAGLDYRDFTGKPSEEFVRNELPKHRRVWVMLMNNGPAGSPDPTTVVLMKGLSEALPKQAAWEFAKVEVRIYSRE